MEAGLGIELVAVEFNDPRRPTLNHIAALNPVQEVILESASGFRLSTAILQTPQIFQNFFCMHGSGGRGSEGAQELRHKLLRA